MATVRNRRGGVSSPFLDFLEKYWMMLLGIIFFAPTVMKWIKDINVEGQKDDVKNTQEVNNAENASQSPEIIRNKVEKYLAEEKKIAKVHRDKIVADVFNLAHNLGYLYDRGNWYDILNPKTWTENDNEIEAVLKRQVHNYPLLERVYYLAFTQSRNLSSDILAVLDKENLTRVRAFWKTYNKSYL